MQGPLTTSKGERLRRMRLIAKDGWHWRVRSWGRYPIDHFRHQHPNLSTPPLAPTIALLVFLDAPFFLRPLRLHHPHAELHGSEKDHLASGRYSIALFSIAARVGCYGAMRRVRELSEK